MHALLSIYFGKFRHFANSGRSGQEVSIQSMLNIVDSRQVQGLTGMWLLKIPLNSDKKQANILFSSFQFRDSEPS